MEGKHKVFLRSCSADFSARDGEIIRTTPTSFICPSVMRCISAGNTHKSYSFWKKISENRIFLLLLASFRAQISSFSLCLVIVSRKSRYAYLEFQSQRAKPKLAHFWATEKPHTDCFYEIRENIKRWIVAYC